MSTRRLLGVIAGIAVALAWPRSADAQRNRTFPHSEHARLFPSCASCHAGVSSGDTSRLYPSPASCTACHDGRESKLVTWRGPSSRPTNLAFAHGVHENKAKAAGEPATCVSCHANRGDTAWMHVARAEPTTCLGCHAHRATEHLAEGAACITCHRKLTDARALPVRALAEFPKPASHSRSDFMTSHGLVTAASLAGCATCHARESCARCHPNANQDPAIRQLAADARMAELVKGLPARYPTPANHTSAGWVLAHGLDARANPARCANCHTQPSCLTCHRGPRGNDVIALLPSAEPGVAPGVTIATSAAGTRLARVHPAGFATDHRAAAASGRTDCLGCHQQQTCTDCHAGASTARRFHAANFLSRHATDAYSGERSCSSCHRVETFCRSCHQQTGMAAKGKANVTAHTRQPVWLLQHGQAARQGLTGCASCHEQRDCLRCHSSQGLHVNPHGPGFDPGRMAARNRQVCFTCHLSDPTKR